MTINQPTFLLHGADYNYEQWLDYPAVLAEDLRLMRAAHCNVMSVGIFSWAMLEPAEGEYQFEWLDRLMDGLADNGLRAILATPSGAKPAWLAHKYPQENHYKTFTVATGAATAALAAVAARNYGVRKAAEAQPAPPAYLLRQP